MDIESIRKRRAHLNALTSSTRLPTLTPLEVFGARPSSVHSLSSSSSSSTSSEKRRLQHRQRPDLYMPRKDSASLVRERSGRNRMPALTIPPMTLVFTRKSLVNEATSGRPLLDPLPDIGQNKEEEEEEKEAERRERMQFKEQENYREEGDAEEVEEELDEEIEEKVTGQDTREILTQPVDQENNNFNLWTKAKDSLLTGKTHEVCRENPYVIPDESVIPDEHVPDESVVPDEHVPDESVVPDEHVPDESIVPDEPVPDDSTVPDEHVPDNSTVPDENVPDESVVPGEQIPDEPLGSVASCEHDVTGSSNLRLVPSSAKRKSSSDHPQDMEKRPMISDELSNENEDTDQPVLNGKEDAVRIVEDMQSEEMAKKLEATVLVRKFLTQSSPSITETFLDADVLTPALANLKDKNQTLVLETVWVLTNIASGESRFTQTLVERGLVEPLVEALGAPYSAVVEQAAWALSNIAADRREFRDQLVTAGVVKLLLAHLNNSTPDSFTRIIAWVLCNLFFHKPLNMSMEEVSLILQALKDQLLDHKNTQTQAEALKAMANFTDQGVEYIQQVVEAGMVEQLVAHLDSSESNMLSSALRAVGNIMTGTDSQTDAVLVAGVLPAYTRLLANCSDVKTRKEILWAISNITAGTSDQIQQVISSGLLTELGLAVQSDEFPIRKEAAWALSNITDVGTREQVDVLLHEDVIRHMLALLADLDPILVSLGVESTDRFLKKSNDPAAVKEAIRECDGVSLLQRHLQHGNDQIAQKVRAILDDLSVDHEQERQTLPQDNHDGAKEEEEAHEDDKESNDQANDEEKVNDNNEKDKNNEIYNVNENDILWMRDTENW
nr:importin subunit alpha-4-like isoform X2 [Cherax quadricarinatus]